MRKNPSTVTFSYLRSGTDYGGPELAGRECKGKGSLLRWVPSLDARELLLVHLVVHLDEERDWMLRLASDRNKRWEIDSEA
jgi:hypothetical protein